MHATLLIKNISRLYTCNKDAEVLQNAYVALYHDKIIAIGQGSYKDLLDPCTRIIDARGEIVVPGFIDCNFLGSRKSLSGDQLREENNALYNMYKNGFLTILNQKRKEQDLKQDFLITNVETTVPILSYGDSFQDFVDKNFCLSCCFGMLENVYAYSIQPIAYELLNAYHVDATKILCAMTSYPAEAFGLDDRGSIEVGKLGDLLIVRSGDLETLFKTIGDTCIHRIIKNGIPVYPSIIRC